MHSYLPFWVPWIGSASINKIKMDIKHEWTQTARCVQTDQLQMQLCSFSPKRMVKNLFDIFTCYLNIDVSMSQFTIEATKCKALQLLTNNSFVQTVMIQHDFKWIPARFASYKTKSYE